MSIGPKMCHGLSIHFFKTRKKEDCDLPGSRIFPVYSSDYHRLQFKRYCTFTEIKVYQCWDEKSIWWFSFYQFHPFYSYVNIFPTYKWCCGVWRSLSLLWQSWSSKLNLTNMRIVSFDISFLLIKIGKFIVIIKVTLILQ